MGYRRWTHLGVELIALLSFGTAMRMLVSIGHEFAAQGWVRFATTFARDTVAALSLAVIGTDWFGFFAYRFWFVDRRLSSLILCFSESALVSDDIHWLVIRFRFVICFAGISARTLGQISVLRSA